MANEITCAQMGSGIPLAYGYVHCTGMRFINHTLPTPLFQSGHDYVSDYLYSDVILDNNGNLQVCTTSGTSGSVPTWDTKYGAYTTTGGATFRNYGPGQDGAQIGFWLLGEGEWDSFISLYNQGAPLQQET